MDVEDKLLAQLDRLELEHAQINLSIAELQRKHGADCEKLINDLRKRSNECLQAWSKLDDEISSLRAIGGLPKNGKPRSIAVIAEIRRIWAQIFGSSDGIGQQGA